METNDEHALYGVNPCLEALRSGKRQCYTLFLDEKNQNAPRFNPLRKAAEQAKVRVQGVTKHDLFNLCQTREHQGVVLNTEPFPYTPLDDSIYEQPKLLLLDNVEDPRNTGAILRSAQIFGFHTVLMPLKGVPEVYPSVVKTSAGATEYLSIVRQANANRYVSTAQARGYRVVALDMDGNVALNDVPKSDSKPLLLVIGGEDKRVGQFILRQADAVATIPQSGAINSLNASVAAGIALYHFS